MSKLNYENVIYEFNWVIRLLNSSETSDQMDVVSRCFQLWENRYVKNKLTKIEKSFISSLRAEYWSLFKNKKTRLVSPSII